MCRSPKKKRCPDCKPEAHCRDVHACWITCVADSEQWGGKGKHSIRMRERKCGILRSRLFRMRDDCDFSNFFAVLVAGTKFPARETSEWMASRFKSNIAKLNANKTRTANQKENKKWRETCARIIISKVAAAPPPRACGQTSTEQTAPGERL